MFSNQCNSVIVAFCGLINYVCMTVKDFCKTAMYYISY